MTATALIGPATLLLGGLGLFLFGVQSLSDGLRDLAGPSLRRLMARATRRAGVGLLIGIAVTALLQSSSAASVMMVSLLDAGLLQLSHSVGLLLGTGLGATVTTQIVMNDWIRPLVLPTVGIGSLLSLFGRQRRIRFTGKTILGFGLLFYGFGLMRSALAPWQDHLFAAWFSSPKLAGPWATPAALMAGLLFTAVIQSSGASVGLVILLASGHERPEMGLALPFVVGCNIGTAVTALLAAAGASRAARRAAWLHAGLRVIGGLLALAMLPIYRALLPHLSPDAGRQIAHFHTLQNLMASLFLLPFCAPLGRLAGIGLDPATDEGAAPRYLDFTTAPGSGAAAAAARLEIARCAQLASGMFSDALRVVCHRTAGRIESVLRREAALDALHATIVAFLMRPRAAPGDADESEINLLQAAHHIERIGDHAENLTELAVLESSLSAGLDIESRGRLAAIGEQTGALAETLAGALAGADSEAPARAARLRDEIKCEAQDLLETTRGRLRAGALGALHASIIEDILHNLISGATHFKKATLATFGRPAGLDDTKSD